MNKFKFGLFFPPWSFAAWGRVEVSFYISMTDNMATTNGMDKDKENSKWKKHGVMKYGKEFTVAVELVGEEKVMTMELLWAIKDVCGEVVGYKMKGERKYEVTMRNGKGRNV